tara:strand:+ start:60271 stop:60423 length:153 start_codon:yes stop_codon:yes gene_type:complete
MKMSDDREAHEMMYDIAMLLSGMFEDTYVDTSLRLRPVPKVKNEKENDDE